MNSIFIRHLLLIVLFGLNTHHTKAQLFVKATELFSRADSLRGQLTPLRSCYDISYYHLDIDVDIANKYISGSNLFKFTAVTDLDRLQFDLFDNLSVDSIRYHAHILNFQREHNAVFIEFPELVPKGQMDSFTVYYSGSPIQASRAPWDGGFDWKKDSNGNPFVATAVQGLGASAWWPNKDHLSDEVDSMLISVSVPKDLMNVSNGRLIRTETIAGDRKKYHWKVHNPINNYNIALNIGDYVHFRDQYAGENGILDMDFYILKENNNKEKRAHLQQNSLLTLEAFEHWFGPYPFYADGYKIVQTAHLGMEHQSAIAYGNKFMNGYLGTDRSGTGWGERWDFIVVHESGHEWFGNNITAADLADMWIHESFTSYSEALFVDYHYGKKASESYVNGGRSNIVNDRPIQGYYDVNNEGSGDMYNKGAVLHHTIRTILGDDERWRAILRGLNKKFYHTQVNYNDIVSYINQETGLDFSKIFEQYVQRSGLPVLEIQFADDGKAWGRWISDVPDFKMPIHLGAKGGTIKLIWLNNNFKSIDIPNLNKDNLEIDTFNYYIGLMIQ